MILTCKKASGAHTRVINFENTGDYLLKEIKFKKYLFSKKGKTIVTYRHYDYGWRDRKYVIHNVTTQEHDQFVTDVTLQFL